MYRKEMLEDLKELNKFVGTRFIDEKMRKFVQKHKGIKLDFGMNKKEFYICGNLGQRII